jgi:hypothetical protein
MMHDGWDAVKFRVPCFRFFMLPFTRPTGFAQFYPG